MYFGPVELRNFGRADEALILHPHGRFRLEFDPGRHTAPVANYFFTDALGSVRVALDAAGVRVENLAHTPGARKRRGFRPPRLCRKPKAGSASVTTKTRASSISTPATTTPSSACSCNPTGSR